MVVIFNVSRKDVLDAIQNPFQNANVDICLDDLKSREISVHNHGEKNADSLIAFYKIKVFENGIKCTMIFKRNEDRITANVDSIKDLAHINSTIVNHILNPDDKNAESAFKILPDGIRVSKGYHSW